VKKPWDEDFIIKQSFSYLVAAFDPRPGQTNVPQIQDFPIVPPGVDDAIQHRLATQTNIANDSFKGTKLALFIKYNDFELMMDDSSKSVFYYAQKLIQYTKKSERPKRIWDEVFKLVYYNSTSLIESGVWLGPPTDLTKSLESNKVSKQSVIHFLKEKGKV
jgi:hypothetical protein